MGPRLVLGLVELLGAATERRDGHEAFPFNDINLQPQCSRETFNVHVSVTDLWSTDNICFCLLPR